MKRTALFAVICSLASGADAAWHEDSWASTAQGGAIGVSVTGTTFVASHADVRLIDLSQYLDAAQRVVYGGGYPETDPNVLIGSRSAGEMNIKNRLFPFAEAGFFLAIASPDISDILNATNEPPRLFVGMTNWASIFPNVPTNFFAYTPAAPGWGQSSSALWSPGLTVTSSVSVPIWGRPVMNGVLHFLYRGDMDSIQYRDGAVTRFSRWISATNADGTPAEYTVAASNTTYQWHSYGNYHSALSTSQIFRVSSTNPSAVHTYVDSHHTTLVTHAESQGVIGFGLSGGEEYVQMPLARYGLLGAREIAEKLKYTEEPVFWYGTNSFGHGESTNGVTEARSAAIAAAEPHAVTAPPRADPTVETVSPVYGPVATNVCVWDEFAQAEVCHWETNTMVIGSNWVAEFSITRATPYILAPSNVVGQATLHLRAASPGGTNIFDACGTTLGTNWAVHQTYDVTTNGIEIIPEIPWGGGRGFQIDGARAIVDWNFGASAP